MIRAITRRVPRSVTRAFLTLAAAVLVTVWYPASPANAHAYLARSAPADGAVLDQAPQSLTLGFTEHVEQSATTVDILDGDGRHWAVTSLVVRAADGDPADAGTDGSGTETP